jgi:hypothetical protein
VAGRTPPAVSLSVATVRTDLVQIFVFPIFTKPLPAVTRRSRVTSSRTLATVPELRAADVCPLFDHLQGPHAPPPTQVFSPLENTRWLESLISEGILKNSTFLSSCFPECVCVWGGTYVRSCYRLRDYLNPLALELDIYSLAHHLCKM